MALNSTSQVLQGVCPGCGARLRFQELSLGELIVCGECQDQLEVVQLTPLKLDWAFVDLDEDDNWDDYDDDDDWDDDDDDDYDDRYYSDYD